MTPRQRLTALVLLAVLSRTPFLDCTITYPVVTISSGQLKGITDDAVVTDGSSKSSTVTKFLGVPFAAPPVGPLRFKAPQPMTSWQGVRDATSYGDMCVQSLEAVAFTKEYMDVYYHHNRTSEDCLTLNIFSPGKSGASGTLPVMVWIHGGAFKWGTGMISDGTQLAVHGNVVVVTFNYRVNIFGFISVNTSGASTNIGLRDQIEALNWVKLNIGLFGGDPDRVTVFGNSAGSISTALLTVSPPARNLFKRAIFQSGTVYYKHLLTVGEGYKASEIIAKQAGCDNATATETLACLRELPSSTLFQAWAVAKLAKNPIVPYYGDDILPIEPGLLFKTGQIGDVDVLLGGNRHDGVGFVPGPVLKGQVTMTKSMFESELRKTIKLFYPLNPDKVLATVVYTYTRDITSNVYQVSYLEAQTDRMVFDIEQTADWLVDAKKSVYFYVFTHTPAVRILPWPTWVFGGHGDEIQYVFGDLVNAGGNAGATDEEKVLSRQMMKAWGNFAATGNPNLIDPSITPALTWMKYTKESRHYLEFNVNMGANRSLQHYRSKQMAFWREVVPEVASADKCVESTQHMSGDTVVHTKNGALLGSQKHEDGQNWEEYLGIPYAAPPVRWRAPVPHPKWSGVRNATEYGAQCYEFTTSPLPTWLNLPNPEYSEDCLFLNVFVPSGVKYVRYMGLPVMVWIHGKAYNTTMNGIYPGHGLALFGSVIVVTINFRMGALGYLPVGLKNVALYDQQLAIDWVYKNIEYFGGDPKKITLVGQSSGAVTATLQALAPSNNGKIRSVIAQSGSPLSPWGINKHDHYNEVKAFAAYFGCSSESVQIMVNCLKEKPAMEIALAPVTVSRKNGYWGPVVEGRFLPKDPMQMIKDGALKDINFIIGSNHHDGYEIASHYSEAELANSSTFSNSISDIFGAMFVNDEAVLSTVMYTWFSDFNSKSEDEKAMTVADMFTGMMYSSPAQRQADVHASAGGKVYLYSFKHRSRVQPSLPTWVEGNHLEEGYYVMGGPRVFNPLTSSNEDKQLAIDIMSYWINFAKHGNPNIGYTIPIVWPSFDSQEKSYLELSSAGKIKKDMQPQVMEFWNTLTPTLEGSWYDTCPATKNETTTSSPPVTWDPKEDGSEREECVSEIGPLRLKPREAHRLLWAFGLLFGFLVIFIFILLAYIIYQRSKFHKLQISGRKGNDNPTYTSSM